MTRNEIKNLFGSLMQKEAYLTQSQIGFIKSVHRYWKTNGRLSDNQLHILNEIGRYAVPQLQTTTKYK